MSARREICTQIAQRRSEAALPDCLERGYNRLEQAISKSPDLHPARLANAVGIIRNIAQRFAGGIDDWMSAWDIARKTGEEDLVDQIIHA